MSHDLQVEHVYDAAPEAVFDAFTDPEAQKELYADAPDWVVRSECDLRAGGRWTIEFGPPGGTPSRGVVTVVQSGFPAAGLRDEFTDGWGGILDGLGRVVATRIA